MAVPSLQDNDRPTSGFLTQLIAKLKNAMQSKWLNAKDVEGASSFRYYSNSGSLPPEYQWSLEVIVSAKSIKTFVTSCYGDKDLYNKEVAITDAQFKQLKDKIAAAGIGKKNTDGPVLCGARGMAFSVLKDGKSVFVVNAEDITFKTEGKYDVLQLFQSIMPKDMAEVTESPEALLPQ